MNIHNKYRYTFLLSSLLFMLVLTPIIAEFRFISFIVSFFLSFTLLSCIFVFSRRITFQISLVLALPYFILNWLFSYFPDVTLIERVNLISGI